MVARRVPTRADSIWIDFDPQAGRGKKSRHPLLVRSPLAETITAIGLPMSRQDYNATNPLAVRLGRC